VRNEKRKRRQTNRRPGDSRPFLGVDDAGRCWALTRLPLATAPWESHAGWCSDAGLLPEITKATDGLILRVVAFHAVTGPVIVGDFDPIPPACHGDDCIVDHFPSMARGAVVTNGRVRRGYQGHAAPTIYWQPVGEHNHSRSPEVGRT
jgi:hypothetical protein